MKIYLLWPGKTKEKWLRDGLDFYLKKLRNYYQVKVAEVKPGKGPGKRKTELMNREALHMERALPKRGRKVALDRCGKMLSSTELARFMSRVEYSGEGKVCFLIGGAFGMAPSLLEQCDLVLSFSKMTFTHDMSRLILLEQLYRAASINAGSPYHH